MTKKNSKEETHGTMNTPLNDLEAKLPDITGGPEISVRRSRTPPWDGPALKASVTLPCFPWEMWSRIKSLSWYLGQYRPASAGRAAPLCALAGAILARAAWHTSLH